MLFRSPNWEGLNYRLQTEAKNAAKGETADSRWILKSIRLHSWFFLSNYFDFCFFKTIPHTITAAKKIKIRYHRFSKQNPLSNIKRYPQEAGKISPIVSKKSGRNSTGNMIPESIIEGKNINCAAIVSFA